MKSILLLGVALLCLGLAGPALAHPPDSIAIAIDSTGFLSVEIHHPVRVYPSNHYLAKATIALNGSTVINQEFKSQSSQEWQYVYYRLIDAKPGDKISVTGECSLVGKLTVDYIVPAFDTGGG